MNQRLDYLDSIRGLAALSVAIYHVISAHWNWTKPGKVGLFLFNGGDAVSLFFVLSGLVLSLRYLDKNKTLDLHYPRYIVNRLFRLFPAFLVMLAIYYGYVFRHDVPFFANWLANKHFWLEEATLLRGHNNLFLPDWTLGVELAISLFVPVLILVARERPQWLVFLMAIVFVAGKVYFNINIFHFCLGVWIASNYEKIRNFDFRRSKIYPFRYLLYLIIFLLFNVRHIVEIHPLGPKAQYFVGLLGIDWFHFSALASGVFLALSINNVTWQKWLSIRPLVFLGKISYSVYLSHWLFINYLLMPRWEYFKSIFITENGMFWAFLSMTLAGTILFSTILYYAIELPFIKIGRRVAQRFD